MSAADSACAQPSTSGDSGQPVTATLEVVNAAAYRLAGFFASSAAGNTSAAPGIAVLLTQLSGRLAGAVAGAGVVCAAVSSVVPLLPPLAGPRTVPIALIAGCAVGAIVVLIAIAVAALIWARARRRRLARISRAIALRKAATARFVLAETQAATVSSQLAHVNPMLQPAAVAAVADAPAHPPGLAIRRKAGVGARARRAEFMPYLTGVANDDEDPADAVPGDVSGYAAIAFAVGDVRRVSAGPQRTRASK